ncbi:MAG: alpha/beta hydrolase family protein [Pirellulales bacterium]
MHVRLAIVLLALVPLMADAARTAEPAPLDTQRGDRMIANYFRHETAALARQSLADMKTLEDWTARRDEFRRQLQEMLGLDPLPPKTDLHPVITGKVDHDQFTVERLHFQSRPGLYVTGNLYLPKGLDKPAPVILYVCGHARVFKDGVAYGAKAAYQHHGGWFARHGFACLTIDTLQLGEIEGLHHGTYNNGLWWWNSRGYTPAGVEAWNCIRALDYLQTRPEIDAERMGVTGRSGGGAYSWWITALDERIKVAVPVAGITDLENHVVDGTVEGHCDCMFMVNTYRWDYGQVAALAAPRPLLISNTDKDNIFPLEGVLRVHAQARHIYRLYGAADKLGVQITEGGHKDTQELHIHAFHWFSRFLKQDDPPISVPAEKLFEPEQLKVFAELPADEINTKIHETFVPLAEIPTLPDDASAWNASRDAWLAALREKSFRGWPAEGQPLDLKPAFAAEKEGISLAAFDFTSQHDISLRLYVLQRAGLEKSDLAVLNVLDDEGWEKFLAGTSAAFAEELKSETLPEADQPSWQETKKMLASFPWTMAYVAPRGVGPTAWDQSERKQVQHRRRFMLLGQTLDGMRVWDARRAVQALRQTPGLADTPVWLQGERNAAVTVLYASLFEPDIRRLDLWHMPTSHANGPDLLNVLRYLDLPASVAMAAERSKIRLYQADAAGWEYPAAVAEKLGWDAKQIQIRALPPETP